MHPIFQIHHSTQLKENEQPIRKSPFYFGDFFMRNIRDKHLKPIRVITFETIGNLEQFGSKKKG